MIETETGSFPIIFFHSYCSHFRFKVRFRVTIKSNFEIFIPDTLDKTTAKQTTKFSLQTLIKLHLVLARNSIYYTMGVIFRETNIAFTFGYNNGVRFGYAAYFSFYTQIRLFYPNSIILNLNCYHPTFNTPNTFTKSPDLA